MGWKFAASSTEVLVYEMRLGTAEGKEHEEM